MRAAAALLVALALSACGGDDAEACKATDAACDDRVAENCIDGTLARHPCATGAGCTTRQVAGQTRALCLAIPGQDCSSAQTQCRGDGAATTCNTAVGKVEVYDCDGATPPAPGCDVCGD